MEERIFSTGRRRSALGVAVALAVSVSLGGCGGSGSSPTSTPTPTPPPVRTVIAQGNFSGLQPVDPSAADFEDFYLLFFVTNQAGTLDITVDWTFDSNDVDFALIRGSLEQVLLPACEDIDSPDCPIELVATAESLAKPETLTISNLAAGSYVVLVVNLGTTNESGVITVGLTS